jgi:chromosome segregation ATPase
LEVSISSVQRSSGAASASPATSTFDSTAESSLYESSIVITEKDHKFLLDRISQLEKEKKAEAERAAKILDSRVADLSHQIADLKTINTTHKKLIVQCVQDKQTAESEVAILRQQLKERIEERSKFNMTVHNALNKLKMQIFDLNKKIAELEKNKGEIVEANRKEKNALQSEIRRLELAKKSVEIKRDELLEEIKSISQQLESAEMELVDLNKNQRATVVSIVQAFAKIMIESSGGVYKPFNFDLLL